MAQEAGMVRSDHLATMISFWCTDRPTGRRCDEAFQDLWTDTQDAYTYREDLDLMIQRRAYIGGAANVKNTYVRFYANMFSCSNVLFTAACLVHRETTLVSLAPLWFWIWTCHRKQHRVCSIAASRNDSTSDNSLMECFAIVKHTWLEAQDPGNRDDLTIATLSNITGLDLGRHNFHTTAAEMCRLEPQQNHMVHTAKMLLCL